MKPQSETKERKYYQTKQQEAVLVLFQEERDGCFTVEEAHQRLNEAGMDIGKTTVYRAITRLWEKGVLRRYAPQESADASRYQLNACADNHLHVRCIVCGELAHLDCEEVSEFCKHITRHHGFALDESQTVLYGRCQNCVKAEGKSSCESIRSPQSDHNQPKK